MTTEVRTPFGTPSPIELSSDGLYRKQVLKFGTIWYTGRDGQRRRIKFDRNYGEELVRAFRQGAFEQVPVQIADQDNRHNNSPTLTGGEVVALALSKDGSGVDGVMRLWGDGHRAVELNNKLGVSARILENLATSDGRSFRKAVQHVLLTVDPQVRGMSPWEKVESVDLSAGTVSESLDLSNETYERSAMSGQNGTGETVTLELSSGLAELLRDPKNAERLEGLLREEAGLEELAAELEALGVDLDDVDDDEDEDPDETEEEDEDEPEDLGLSGPAAEAIELTNATVEGLGARVIELTNQLTQQRLAAEVDKYRREGLAPAVIEMATPLLEIESGAIELSNGVGDPLDPGKVMRDVLDTVLELSNSGHLIVGDGLETGSLQGRSDDESRREAMLAAWDAEYGN